MKEKDITYIVVMFAAFFATYLFNINIFYIILVCGAIGAYKILHIKEEI